jgi:hypothetical protein
MIITLQEQWALLKAFTKEKPRTIDEESAFVDGMEAAFKLVDKKMKEKKK